ncbi:MAG: hypothetical protein ACREXR_01660 [Gammaproteobacteria bacterium]
MFWLVAHFLGRKHRRSIKKVMQTAYGVDPTNGKRALYIDKGDKRVFLWNKPPQRSSVFSKVVGAKDIQPLPIAGWRDGHSYEPGLWPFFSEGIE